MRSFLVAVVIASACGLNLPPPTLQKVSTLNRWVSEAEKKHGRVAMLAVPTLVTIAVSTRMDPVVWLNSQPATSQLVFYSVAATLESLNLKRFGKGFSLKEDETPGMLFKKNDPPPPLLSVLEDGVGRLAMIAALGIMVNSLVPFIVY